MYIPSTDTASLVQIVCVHAPLQRGFPLDKLTRWNVASYVFTPRQLRFAPRSACSWSTAWSSPVPFTTIRSFEFADAFRGANDVGVPATVMFFASIVHCCRVAV
jgi:hypothetical protein